MSSQSPASAFHGGLVVSCQALPGEPLYRDGGGVMPLLARAAAQSGAVGIRASSARDVREIRAAVDLPVIGLVKREYPPFEPFITPTMREVDELIEVGADVIAFDATLRERPDGESVAAFVAGIRERDPNVPLMADIATHDDALAAAAAGVDLIGTTLRGYTEATRDAVVPDATFVASLAAAVDVPIVAEGRIHSPEQARAMLDAGAWCVVVGGAITRPAEITARFVAALA